MEPSDSARLVFALAYRYYRRLPLQARGFLALEDFAAIAFLQIEERKEQYDPKRAAYRTWVYRTAQRAFQDILKAHAYQMRQAEPVDLNKIGPSVLSYGYDAENSLRERRVERFLRLASDEMRETLSGYFFGGRIWRNRDYNTDRLHRLQGEAKRLRTITSASVEDFLYVRGLC